MQRDQANTFSRTTIALHWLVALSIIGMLSVGIYMVETETYSLYPWHKSIGFCLFFIVLLRVIWRIKNGWPTPVGQHAAYEQMLAKITHWFLITATVLMPLSGFLMSALGGHGVDVFGVEVVARNANPEDPAKALAHNKELASLSHSIHHWLAYGLVGAIFLHVSGALKHHVLDEDGTLRRMLGKSV